MTSGPFYPQVHQILFFFRTFFPSTHVLSTLPLIQDHQVRVRAWVKRALPIINPRHRAGLNVAHLL